MCSRARLISLASLAGAMGSSYNYLYLVFSFGSKFILIQPHINNVFLINVI